MGSSQSHHKVTYSIAIENPHSSKGESPIYRHPKALNGLLKGLEKWSEIATVQELYLKAFTDFADLPFLETRQKHEDGSYGRYSFKTYREVRDLAERIGSAIINLDLSDVSSDIGASFIGIWSKNREEWVITEIACALYKIVLLPFFDSLGLSAIKFVFDSTNVQTFFTSADHLDRLLDEVIRGEFENLKNIVSFDPIKKETYQKANEANIRIYTWADILLYGEQKLAYPKIHSTDIYAFGYTSGTTDKPKAAIFDNTNFIAAVGGAYETSALQSCKPGEVHISYLPMAHMYERLLVMCFISLGFRIGYLSGDVSRLLDDVLVLKPTVFVGVPRLYNRFYESILGSWSRLPERKRRKARKAMQEKIRNIRTKGKYTHFLYDKHTKALKAFLGENLKLCFSGGALLSPEIANFLEAALSCPILEGYGSTETIGLSHLQDLYQTESGNVGCILPCLEMKLIDVPEMNYLTSDRDPWGGPMPRGEICLRGGSVFKGYYKDALLTVKAIDMDGWYHTGDIGMIMPNGALKIIDRMCNIIKLSQGENVEAERVENVLMTSKYIGECWIYGDSQQPNVVAIVVPNKNCLEALAKEKHILVGSYGDLIADPRIKDFLMQEIFDVAKQQQLQPYEVPTNIFVEEKSFVLQGLTTPTFKLKRNDMKARYQNVLDEMYLCKIS